MNNIKARNTNALSREVYPRLSREGILNQSRNGPVLRFPEPVTITLSHPAEKVNFNPSRDANPFFHLVEAMAMLVRYNSVSLLAYYAKNIANYSDNGNTFNAFYGERARQTWGDQISAVVSNLIRDPDSRRELVLLWDPADLFHPTRDKACNLLMLFEIDQQTGCLNMVTFNRSNDAIWGGVTGANIVHFPFFQEYIAAALGRKVGVWHHTSANLHVYTEAPQWNRVLQHELDGLPNFGAEEYPPYLELSVGFEDELKDFLTEFDEYIKSGEVKMLSDFEWDFEHEYLRDVVGPMVHAHILYKQKKPIEEIREVIHGVKSEDWRLAGYEWIARRYNTQTASK